jgi:hypothetical protein
MCEATPRLERNDLFYNQACALLVEAGAAPLVRKNLVRDGKSDGIVIGANGLGIFEGNRIFMNSNIGFKVHRNGAPIVRDNAINNGNGVGVCLEAGAMGDFSDNIISGNYGDQIRVQDNRYSSVPSTLPLAPYHLTVTLDVTVTRPSLHMCAKESKGEWCEARPVGVKPLTLLAILASRNEAT